MACVLASAYYANAQGTVNFVNTAQSLIKLLDGVTGVPVGQFTVGLLYWATDPGAVNLNGSLAAFNMIKTATLFSTPGRFIGGTATTPTTTPAGSPAYFAVVAWQTSFGSYDATRTGQGLYGWSSVFQNPTGNPNASPPVPAQALSAAFTGITVTQVPEPSVIALAALGFGALLLRRRKVANQ